MRIRDGPAAVRGDAPPPRSHWREPGRRRGREPRVRRPVALLISGTPRGREDSGASLVRHSRRLGAGRAHPVGRGSVRWPVRRRLVPRHGRRLERKGHGLEATDPHRLALADGDRDALRDRRGAAGRRRRRPVRLPEERATDVAVGLHPERRGDRRLPARPRRHRVRPQGPVGRAPAARHHRAPPGRREELQGRVPADPPARDGHRPRRGGGEARLRHEGEDRRHREEGAQRVGRGSPCTTS